MVTKITKYRLSIKAEGHTAYGYFDSEQQARNIALYIKYPVTVEKIEVEICDGEDDCGQSDCQKCCGNNGHEFDPDEGYTCLNCGKDGAEEVLSAAYDRAKDIRKYGE